MELYTVCFCVSGFFHLASCFQVSSTSSRYRVLLLILKKWGKKSPMHFSWLDFSLHEVLSGSLWEERDAVTTSDSVPSSGPTEVGKRGLKGIKSIYIPREQLFLQEFQINLKKKKSFCLVLACSHAYLRSIASEKVCSWFSKNCLCILSL